MAEFINPNKPPQPQRGVYTWSAQKEGERVCLYVGRAGRTEKVQAKGTLLRGVCELFRHTFSSEKTYRKLDTDFIVGTVILYIEKRGFRCTWEHVCDDPSQEGEFTLRFKPILQDTRSRLHEVLQCTSSEHGFWRLTARASKEERCALFDAASLQVEAAIETLLRKQHR